MSKPLKTKANLISLLDETADLIAQDQRNTAEQTNAINALKKAQKAVTNETKKSLTSLKGRISRWVKTNAELLFGESKKGTIQSNQAELTLADNPPKIQPLDKDTPEEELVNHAIRLGFDDLIETKQFLSRKALSALSNDSLQKLGFERVQGQTLSIKLLANTKARETAKSS